MMFRKCFLAALLIILLTNISSGQSLTVESYTNQLFFNVFKEPDASIRDFLKLYVPSLLEKKTVSNEAANKNQYSQEEHFYVFTKHPFFNSSFNNGKLEFDCRRYNDARSVQVTDVRLWLGFDTQEDAEIAFDKLVRTFEPISSAHKVNSINGALRGQFTDAKSTSAFSKVMIRLTADNLDRSKFRLLIELGNDL